MKKRYLLPIISVVAVVTTTFAAIKFAQGYRPNLQTGGLQGTGLLVANSFPKGAQVFINGKLTTATDETLNLSPGTYQVEIKLDGFSPWKKTLALKEELVTQTNAVLFSSIPSLKPLSTTGAKLPTPSPDGTKIAFIVQNAANPIKNGFWILELSGVNLLSSREPRQISQSLNMDLSQSKITWSPDSRDLLINSLGSNYLLDVNRFNDQANLTDVTARLPLIFSDWEETLARKEQEKLLTLPEKMQQIATASATNLYFSPDEEKILYTATDTITIPEGLQPPLPSKNTQPETRTLEPGATYVYDLKEDKNFKVLEVPPAELGLKIKEKIALVNQIKPLPLIAAQASPSAHIKLQKDLLIPETIDAFNSQYSPLSIQNIQWFPTSKHIIINQNNNISIMEYDSTNQTNIFVNTFENNFVYPWPDGSQLIILTNLNQSSQLPANLYSINLK